MKKPVLDKGTEARRVAREQAPKPPAMRKIVDKRKKAPRSEKYWIGYD